MIQTRAASTALVMIVIGNSRGVADESIVTQKIVAIVTTGAVHGFFHAATDAEYAAAAPAKITAPAIDVARSFRIGRGSTTSSGTLISPTFAIDGNWCVASRTISRQATSIAIAVNTAIVA